MLMVKYALLMNNSESKFEICILNSGCTRLIFNRRENFANFTEAKGTAQIRNKYTTESVGYETVYLSTVFKRIKGTVLLQDVLCTADLMYNFTSLPEARRNMFKANIDNDCVDPTFRAIGKMHQPSQEVKETGFENSDRLYEKDFTI